MNILVTGATRGIGKAVAELLDGKIYATGRNEELLKSYKNHIFCDLTNQSDLERLGDYIEENKIDVLVNNAGEYVYSRIEDCKYSEIERIIKTNLESPLYLISRAIPYMKQQKWGRIINIGSISGVMGEACASIYSASKAGLIGATKAIGLEVAEFGITVNTINPGWVNTDLGNSSANDSEFSKAEIVDCIPQRRFVEPIEVATLARYLISDEAKGITGQSINLCAGLSVGC